MSDVCLTRRTSPGSPCLPVSISSSSGVREDGHVSESADLVTLPWSPDPLPSHTGVRVRLSRRTGPSPGRIGARRVRRWFCLVGQLSFARRFRTASGRGELPAPGGSVAGGGVDCRFHSRRETENLGSRPSREGR